MGIFISLATWLEPLLVPAGVPAETSGALLLAILVTGVVGCVVVPPSARAGTRARTLGLTGIVTATSCVLLAVSPTPAVGIAAALPVGFLLLAVLPVALSLVEGAGSPSAGAITSILWLSGNAGGIAVSFCVGQLLDVPSVVFVLFAALALGMAALARWLEHGGYEVAGADGHDQLAPGGHPRVGQESGTGPPQRDLA
ncbi:hypothetical protein [Actinokineospora iranica]|uniref:Major Facilitator Superfamily protein n=1 Tax=Actinokineospora iranica TaxID=1271860 RepID=A0A1G6QGY2_9PSEU|nr:hypothetical protein [Actinokineospora iranica]SDC91649.1 hypothetical protein SAMN05216174_105289 [Actinokineospora iranica]